MFRNLQHKRVGMGALDKFLSRAKEVVHGAEIQGPRQRLGGLLGDDAGLGHAVRHQAQELADRYGVHPSGGGGSLWKWISTHPELSAGIAGLGVGAGGAAMLLSGHDHHGGDELDPHAEGHGDGYGDFSGYRGLGGEDDLEAEFRRKMDEGEDDGTLLNKRW